MWWWDDMEPTCYECYDSTVDLDSPNPDEPWPCGHCNEDRQLWRDKLQEEFMREQFEEDFGACEERAR